MNKALLFAALFALVTLSAAVKLSKVSPQVQWRDFKRTHNKQYASDMEETLRFTVFKQNLNLIDELNARPTAAKFRVNQFADLTQDEFRSKVLSKTPAVKDPSWPVAPLLPQAAINALPVSFDWREKGAVTPVKNQGQCGSCWSFSTTGNVEGQWFLAGHNLTSLSEQNLVDCDHECMQYDNQQSCDAGCDGGLQPNAYNYIIKNSGIDTEDAYPYTAFDGKCNFKSDKVGATISNWTMISEDEDQMAAYLVAHGPLAIAADAAEWQFYWGGVFDFPCGKQLDHGILIVGFGNQMTILGKKNYWIVKNSWGETWGEEGYLKIERGNGKCGLNTFVSSSIIA